MKTSPLSLNETICPTNEKHACPIASLRDGSGGWFDAGDYSKYIATGTAAVWRLLTTVDIMLLRNLPLLDNLNIPESYDGIPDLLNEADWEIKWVCFCFKIVSLGFDICLYMYMLLFNIKFYIHVFILINFVYILYLCLYI